MTKEEKLTERPELLFLWNLDFILLLLFLLGSITTNDKDGPVISVPWA